MGTKKKADKVTPDRRNQAEYAYIEKTLYARKRGKKERTTTEKKKRNDQHNVQTDDVYINRTTT